MKPQVNYGFVVALGAGKHPFPGFASGHTINRTGIAVDLAGTAFISRIYYAGDLFLRNTGMYRS